MTDTTPETARLTADVVLFAENNPGQPGNQLHVLLIKRRWDPYKDHWALPGGHVDNAEGFRAAAYRELAEETGIRPGRMLERVDIYDQPDRDPRGRYITVAYTAVVDGMPTPAAADDATEARWFLVDEALADSMKLAFDHGRILADALRIVI